MKDINAILFSRAARLKERKLIADLLGQGYILAGGAMRSDEPRDFDIYGFDHAIDIGLVRNACMMHQPWIEIVEKTNNALTVKLGGQTIQFCRHFKPSAYDLVKSFDFSHIQAGVVFGENGEPVGFASTSLFNCVEDKLRPPEYTGSEYPLSSLSRMLKFYERGDFSGADRVFVLGNLLRIVCDIVKRGYTSFEDFEDQCSAISSAVEEFDAMSLFDKLFRGGEAK